MGVEKKEEEVACVYISSIILHMCKDEKIMSKGKHFYRNFPHFTFSCWSLLMWKGLGSFFEGYELKLTLNKC